MKILFFHVPCLSKYNLCEPVLLELAGRGHAIVHYNHAEFRRYIKTSAIEFRPYHVYGGYQPSRIGAGVSLDELGLMLLETAEQTLDCVESAVRDEHPDVVVHTEFTVAAKVAARKQGVPAACLTSGSVVHPDVFLEHARRHRAPVNLANVSASWHFRKRAKKFYDRHGGDSADIFMNTEALSLVCGFEQFQHGSPHLWARHRFVGPTVQIRPHTKTHELIYVSLGSVFADNRAFFDLCIQALATVNRRVVISLGDRLSPAEFNDLPPNIEVASFVAQTEILQRAALFITHGGASSIFEAVACATPMIVIPQMAEQQFSAYQIEKLGLGKYIAPEELTEPRLRATVCELLEGEAWRTNVERFLATWPTVPPAVTASDLIEELVTTRMSALPLAGETCD